MSTKTNTTTPLRATMRTISIQLYSLLAWLLIIFGGMVMVGNFFVGELSLMSHVSSLIVGVFTVLFGLGLARLLNKDIRQTVPVFWF